MLVNAKGMLDKALAGHYAVPQFNINDLEWTNLYCSPARKYSLQ